MNAPTDITPDVQRQADEAARYLEEARSLPIATSEQYEQAGEELKRIKAKAKDLEEMRKEMTRPLDESKKRIMDFFRRPLGFLADAEADIKRRMRDFALEQERRRREAEAAAQEAARKERERLEREAAKLAAKGRAEKAEAVLSIAEQMPTPVVAAPAPKVSGISMRVRYSARVTDKMALIKAVAEGRVPDNVLEPNMTALNGLARSLKEHLAYPGVEVLAEHDVAARTA